MAVIAASDHKREGSFSNSQRQLRRFWYRKLNEFPSLFICNDTPQNAFTTMANGSEIRMSRHDSNVSAGR